MILFNLIKYFDKTFNDETKLKNCNTTVSHTREAYKRIQEFNRLKRAKQLLDAISFTNELLADGSDIEILSLANIIIKRLKTLGICNNVLGKYSFNHKDIIYFSFLSKNNFAENSCEDIRNTFRSHIGIYHCYTFCSSGGKKEVICGCEGIMPGNIYSLNNFIICYYLL